MEPLNSHARALLDALRVAETPNEARMQAVVHEAVRTAATLPPLSATASVTGSGLGAGWIAAAAAVVGVTAVSTWLLVGEAPRPEEPQASAPRIVRAEAMVPDSDGTAPSEAAAVPSQEPTTTARANKRRRAPMDERRAFSPQAPGPDALAAELALLQAAHRTLEGDPARVLRFAAEHDRKFPKGPLAGEIEVLRVQALCRLGQKTQARARIDRYVAAHGGGHLDARLRGACPGA